MRRLARPALIFGLVLQAAWASADVGVEYVGHASFVIESPSGQRVVIDPFNSNRWLGYAYPEVAGDVVLVSHPHYDHDASYYWGDSVPVFREPGRYQVGDFSITGFEGRHADPYGKDFERKNTIWVIETGGLRIAHLGDNGPLSEAQARGIGRVDVLMLPADGDDHILKPHEIAAAREATGDPLVIPMHYRLEGFLGLPDSLGLVDPWLETQDGVVKLGSHRATLSSERSPGRRVVVFEPSPALEVWSDDLQAAWAKLDAARDAMEDGPNGAERAGALVAEAAASSSSIVFSFQYARALSRAGKDGDAVAVLESAIARSAGQDDWEYVLRARALLAALYVKAGERDAAASQFRIILQNAHRTELTEQAQAFFAGR